MRFLDWDRGDPDPVISAISKEFEEGRPVIIPSDTLYGLAAPVSRSEVMEKIFDIKKRSRELTLPVAIGSLSSMELVSRPDERMKGEIEMKLPGPFTFILPAADGLPDLVIRNGTVAVRIPDHPIFPLLERETGPIGLTSANIHGEGPVSGREDALVQFGSRDILMIIDGKLILENPSEILDLTGTEPMVLRRRR